ncbi:amidase [bacterium]|nr:amidase [bacterium]
MNAQSSAPLKRLLFIVIPLCLVSLVFNALHLYQHSRISTASIGSAQHIPGLHLTAAERKRMVNDLREKAGHYDEVRALNLQNSDAPAIDFNCVPPGFTIRERTARFIPGTRKNVMLPQDIEAVAFFTLPELAELIRTGRMTSLELTELYLERLKTYGPKLKCVISLTEELALQQARRADEEIAAGRYKGILHGIPYGVKDLLAVPGYKTTWGAAPYKDQVLDYTATVVKKLEDAGAVLVAKLSMGALAMDDVWFGGQTVNPWDSTQGSSGSSAGSASATSAGLVGFSIGTETWGSIVSPSTRCRVSGLRPTYGRVSRAGAMALSWTMDKIGPICRSAEGCACVFQVINGADPLDRSTRDVPFDYDGSSPINHLRIGYLKTEFEKDTANVELYSHIIEMLSKAGGNLVPAELPEFPVYSLSYILDAEAAAAFDDLTRSNRDDLLVRQRPGDWPDIFRQARFIPAVEYIQANRARLILMQKLSAFFADYDVLVVPSFGSQLLMTNLTGHPAAVVPVEVTAEGRSMSISFIGQLFEDGKVLEVARAFQSVTDYHLKHPDLSWADEDQ